MADIFVRDDDGAPALAHFHPFLPPVPLGTPNGKVLSPSRRGLSVDPRPYVDGRRRIRRGLEGIAMASNGPASRDAVPGQRHHIGQGVQRPPVSGIQGNFDQHHRKRAYAHYLDRLVEAVPNLLTVLYFDSVRHKRHGT